jgi:hypothetical protein
VVVWCRYGRGSDDARNASLCVEQDRHDDVASLANEDGDPCRTDRLRERLPTGGEEAKQRQGEECGCVQDGRDAREAGAVGDMVGVRSDLLESHIRGLAACTPPWRSRTRTDAVEEASAPARTRPGRTWSAARRASGGPTSGRIASDGGSQRVCTTA